MMRISIFILTLCLSCGTIEGDVNVNPPEEDKKNSEENPSESLQDHNEEITEQAIKTDTESIADNCQAGKLCRGLTKEEVQDLLGDPTAVSVTGNYEKWTYSELMADSFLCVPLIIPSYADSTLTENCSVSFRAGILTRQEGLKAEWIDLANF